MLGLLFSELTSQKLLVHHCQHAKLDNVAMTVDTKEVQDLQTFNRPENTVSINVDVTVLAWNTCLSFDPNYCFLLVFKAWHCPSFTSENRCLYYINIMLGHLANMLTKKAIPARQIIPFKGVN